MTPQQKAGQIAASNLTRAILGLMNTKDEADRLGEHADVAVLATTIEQLNELRAKYEHIEAGVVYRPRDKGGS